MTHALDLAARINRMKPGQQFVIAREELLDLRGARPFETGWDRVRANVIGSDHPDIWSFEEDPITGDVTVKRFEERDR